MKSKLNLNKPLGNTNKLNVIQEAKPIRTRSRAYCHLCCKTVGLLSEASAAKLLQTNDRVISMLVTRKTVHRIHNSKGVKMICENALKAIEQCFRVSRTITVKPIEIH